MFSAGARFLLFKFNNHYDRIYTEIYLLLINQIDQIDCVPKQMRNHLRGLKSTELIRWAANKSGAFRRSGWQCISAAGRVTWARRPWPGFHFSTRLCAARVGRANSALQKSAPAWNSRREWRKFVVFARNNLYLLSNMFSFIGLRKVWY